MLHTDAGQRWTRYGADYTIWADNFGAAVIGTIVRSGGGGAAASSDESTTASVEPVEAAALEVPAMSFDPVFIGSLYGESDLRYALRVLMGEDGDEDGDDQSRVTYYIEELLGLDSGALDPAWRSPAGHRTPGAAPRSVYRVLDPPRQLN